MCIVYVYGVRMRFMECVYMGVVYVLYVFTCMVYYMHVYMIYEYEHIYMLYMCDYVYVFCDMFMCIYSVYTYVRYVVYMSGLCVCAYM